MFRHKNTGVLVVGAGPVGMLTSLLLAQNGVDVQIIDQDSNIAGRSFACALHPRTLKLLDMVGAAADAIHLGRRVDSIAIYEGGEKRATLDLSKLPTQFPFILVLDQCTLEALLERQLNRLAKTKILWDHRLDNFEMSADGVTANIEKLAFTGKGYSVPDFGMGVQRTFSTRAQYIVGADGSTSHVRNLLGIPYEKSGEPELYVVYEAESKGDTGNEVKMVLDPDTTSVMWPLPGHRYRWSFQLQPTDLTAEFPGKDRTRYLFREAAGDDDSKHRLAHLFHTRAPWFKEDVVDIDWVVDIQFEKRLAREFGLIRCWLAGDAAHQTSPVGMQSLNEGLWEAADLAETLTHLIKGSSAPGLLDHFNNDHLGAWHKLLGLGCAPKPTALTEPWAAKYASELVSKIPASGRELKLLLGQLNLQLD